MGVDIIGWRACALQERLGVEAFLQRLKLRSHKRAVEAQVSEEARAKVKLRVVVGESERTLSYEDLGTELGSFEQGIAECAACPLSGGRPVECYRYVTYPIELALEEVMFAFFCEQLPSSDSSSALLFDEAVRHEVGRQTAFHDRPGLAEGEAPFDARFELEGEEELVVDSAELLTCVFGLAEELPSQATVSEFLADFLWWIDEKAAAGTVETRVSEEGVVELSVSMPDEVSTEELSFRLALSNAARGKTLGEVRTWNDMLKVVVEHADDGWYQIVHG